MVLRHLPFLALLVAGATSFIHCPHKDSCFAESPDCDPNEDCETVLRFDDNGNMDLFVRNITTTDYVSIIADRDLFHTIEYFICVPFSGQRLRAMGRAGQIALFTQQNLTNVVERLGSNFFQCIFNAHELSRNFRQNREFIVSRGEFQQFLSVNEGFKLHRLEMDHNKDVDENLEADSILPNIYKVRASTHARESVFSTDENKMASNVLHKMQKMYANSDGFGIDELVTKRTPIAKIHANIKHLDNGVNGYDDVDDAHSNLDSDNEDDEDVHSRRHRTQSKTRATRYENNDEGEKDETGMRALKRSSNGHSTSHQMNQNKDVDMNHKTYVLYLHVDYDFYKGVIIGFLSAVLIFSLILVFLMRKLRKVDHDFMQEVSPLRTRIRSKKVPPICEMSMEESEENTYANINSYLLSTFVNNYQPTEYD